MIYTTLKEYVENYQTNLDAYLETSEINMKSDFLYKEQNKYFNYSQALFKISRFCNNKTLKNDTIIGGAEYLLERIDSNVYKEIVTIVDKIKDGMSQPPGYYRINVDIEKLEYYQKNVDLILKFIESQTKSPNDAFQEYMDYKFPDLTINTTTGANKTSTTENQKIIDEDYKTKNWFKIGLLFANGEMEKLLKKFNRNSTQIAKELGDVKGLRPYISESIGINKATSKKSIFSDRQKMEKIILHCKISNIPVLQHFKDNIPLE